MKNTLKQYIVITIGFIICSIAVYFFLMPNNIAAGGVTGLGMIINHYVPALPVGMLMIFMNVLLFVISFVVLGRKFGIKTIYASFGFSGVIWLLERTVHLENPVTDDPLLAVIIGTSVSGFGMAMIFNFNASTGGTDILAKILNRYFHIDIGKSLFIIDFIITLMAAFTFGIQKGLYAIIAVAMNGYIIDYIIAGFNIVMQVFIMTKNTDIIAEYIMNELDRGVTFFTGEGGFSGNGFRIIYTVLSRKEFIRLRSYIRKVDPKAFITVSDAHEVLGEGFKNMNPD